MYMKSNLGTTTEPNSNGSVIYIILYVYDEILDQ